MPFSENSFSAVSSIDVYKRQVRKQRSRENQPAGASAEGGGANPRNDTGKRDRSGKAEGTPGIPLSLIHI